MSLSRSLNARPGIRGVRGFTLVELAVVLVIMGLVGWLFYGTIFGLGHKEKSSQAERDLNKAESALQGLVVTTRGLPAKRETVSITAYPQAGLLPVSVSLQHDPWDQDVLYFAAPEVTGPKTLASALSTSLRVRVYSGVGSGGAFPAADAPLERETANVAYVLLSLGPNRSGQATVTVSGGITTVNLLRGGGPLNDGTGLEYDDLARYGSLGQLKALAP